ncbi:ABC transporter ATP-binding protein [Salicola sp. Rm-C-2C1-2]|uniref:ABC transporter ATP-binding protein n=1 Tax=Salicola sp. Rm-C-2C1-2 TaxID=3141321 RepID=UPI0032E396F9
MIEVEHLTRQYGALTAVRDVGFRIERGEVVGLLGPNGAGKTTIMKMITGALEPTSGAVRVDDLVMGQDTPAIQQRIGYLPENCPLWPEMTVIDYLAYMAELRRIPPEQRNRAIAGAIRRTDLVEKAGDRIDTLSRGYQQRVGVAQALLHEPELLILDEPTNGLDPSQIHQMRDLIRDLAREATVILSTHVLQEVQAVCERVLIMRSGNLAVDERLADLTASEAVDVVVSGSGNAAAVLESVAGVAEVTAMEADHQGHRYRLSGTDEAVPAAVNALVGAGFNVHAVEPGRRDLETLFESVIQEASHA